MKSSTLFNLCQLFFFLALISFHTSEGNFFNNLIDNIEYPICDQLLKNIPHKNIVAPSPVKISDLQGRWISQSCETRPGLIHVTRSYSFSSTGKMEAVLHSFADDFCTKPKLSVVAEGDISLKRTSLSTPGGTEAEYYIESLSVVIHSHKGLVELSDELNSTSCPASVMERIKPYHRLFLLKSPVTLDDMDISALTCVPSLYKTWNEFQLMRIEVLEQRKAWNKHSSCRPKELYLGDLHSNPKWQKLYRPTSYQAPLVEIECIKNCPLCDVIVKSSPEAPPLLPKETRIFPPSIMEGVWASTKCEVQRHGLFLTRKISFRPSRPRWSIKQRYFSDPFCSKPTYTILASGTYKRPGRSLRNDDGEAFDMIVRKMSITPDDKNFAAQLNRIPGRRCGVPGKWKRGKMQDITFTGGCGPIGLKVPSKEPEILRLISHDKGQISLLLGLTPTWPHRGIESAPRPTAWSPPLRKCSPLPIEDNHLRPVVGARIALAAAPKVSCMNWFSLVMFVVIVMCIYD